MKKKLFERILITLVLFSACKKEQSPEATAPKCKLTEMNTAGSDNIGSSDASTYNSTEKFTYNEQQLLSGNSYQIQSKYTGNKTGTYSYSYNYQYDVRGYLVKTVFQSEGKDKDNNINTYTYTDEFSYNNNKLIKRMQALASYSQGKTVTGTNSTSYEYTPDGKLAKYSTSYATSEGASGITFTIYEYSNGKLSKIASTNERGVTTSPLIEVNNLGNVIKSVSSSREFRFRYDANNNLISKEEYSGGKKTGGYLYETDSKQNIYALSRPTFKGHPNIEFYYGKNSRYNFSGNMVKEEWYYTDGTGVDKVVGGFYLNHTYNASNLPTTTTWITKNDKGATVSQSTTSYTYTGCN